MKEIARGIECNHFWYHPRSAKATRAHSVQTPIHIKNGVNDSEGNVQCTTEMNESCSLECTTNNDHGACDCVNDGSDQYCVFCAELKIG